MKLSAKTCTVLISSAALSGTLLGIGGPAQADDPAPMPAAINTWVHSIQNDAHNTNLDSYRGEEVVTRYAYHTNQVWRGDRVGKTTAGVGIYTIRPVSPPAPASHAAKCLTFKGEDKHAKLEPCISGQLNQRWVVNTALEKTSIIPEKARDLRLEATDGDEKPVKAKHVDDDPDQQWALYDK
ncbi:RICIN domain-containing protein [Streptomyces sp. NPDC003077]|uniref:RICIN domain-containing protein n=1 Tax=Streptomyces sp. NPDC003077 TaxID=3154443 RepID=UPI0033BF6152